MELVVSVGLLITSSLVTSRQISTSVAVTVNSYQCFKPIIYSCNFIQSRMPLTYFLITTAGPLFVFETPSQDPTTPQARPSMALSPLSHFTSNKAISLGVNAAAGSAFCSRCEGYSTSALLLARPALKRTTLAFGSFMRQYYNTTRSRGTSVSGLSYWNDNQAGYSGWTVGDDQTVWGKPGDIYLKLKEGYDKHKVPIRAWEPDNNWNVTYQPIKNWIGRSWETFNETLYPTGGEEWVSKMGNLSMTYYTNGFGQDNAYSTNPAYKMTKSNEPHPTASRKMYGDLIGNSKKKFNMDMLFTDFLCYRGPMMGQKGYQDVPYGEEAHHMWLGGMTQAAADHGVEVQS